MKSQKQKTQNPDNDMEVGKDVSDSVIVTGNGNVINMGKKKTPSSIPNKKSQSKRKQKPTRSLFIAIIGAVATILAAIISSPFWASFLIKGFSSTPIVTATLVTESPALPPTEVPTLPPTEVPDMPATDLPAGTEKVSRMDGMKISYVPAGEFVMGAENGDPDELPIHKVYLDSFWIDQTEVTNAMYKLCVDAKVCPYPVNEDFFGKPKYENYPVVYITWNNANSYCSWAGRRLPTEAEWEKSARGTDGRTYPWGEGIDCKKANYGGCFRGMRIVGVYNPAPYGTFDVVGNAWEWVSDWYGEFYYQKSPYENPLGPSNGEVRVLRGGSWESREKDVRTPERGSSPVDYSNYKISFRCATSTP